MDDNERDAKIEGGEPFVGYKRCNRDFWEPPRLSVSEIFLEKVIDNYEKRPPDFRPGGRPVTYVDKLRGKAQLINFALSLIVLKDKWGFGEDILRTETLLLHIYESHEEPERNKFQCAWGSYRGSLRITDHTLTVYLPPPIFGELVAVCKSGSLATLSLAIDTDNELWYRDPDKSIRRKSARGTQYPLP